MECGADKLRIVLIRGGRVRFAGGAVLHLEELRDPGLHELFSYADHLRKQLFDRIIPIDAGGHHQFVSRISHFRGAIAIVKEFIHGPGDRCRLGLHNQACVAVAHQNRYFARIPASDNRLAGMISFERYIAA